MQAKGFELLRARVWDIPLPSMQTARIFQDGWQAECRGALEFMQSKRTTAEKVVVADLMIDRALFAFQRAPTNKVRLYAAVGALRFVAMRRSRFLEVKATILNGFLNNPPDSVKARLEQVEASMYQAH